MASDNVRSRLHKNLIYNLIQFLYRLNVFIFVLPPLLAPAFFLLLTGIKSTVTLMSKSSQRDANSLTMALALGLSPSNTPELITGRRHIGSTAHVSGSPC